MSRLFFALWPDERVRSELLKVSESLKQDHFRQTRLSNLHITLVFLGEVSPENQDELIDRINKIHAAPFQLLLGQIGVWLRPGILWLAPKEVPESLAVLINSIRSCVRQQGLKTEVRAYKPHVTLARKVKRVVKPEGSANIVWDVSSFVLVESKSAETGIEYHVLQRWPLMRGA